MARGMTQQTLKEEEEEKENATLEVTHFELNQSLLL